MKVKIRETSPAFTLRVSIISYAGTLLITKRVFVNNYFTRKQNPWFMSSETSQPNTAVRVALLRGRSREGNNYCLIADERLSPRSRDGLGKTAPHAKHN